MRFKSDWVLVDDPATYFARPFDRKPESVSGPTGQEVSMNVEEIEKPLGLEALRVAAGHMTNGHGLQLYDLLEEKARQLR